MGAWLHAPSTIRQRWVWPAASFSAVIPNFVGYIDISDLNAVFNNALRADGLDARCFIEDVAAVLDRELVDTYNQGAQTGQLYVRFNASNAADTVMEIYGGAGDLVANDAGTWTGAGYLCVIHMEENAGNFASSTGTGDGAVTGGTYSQVAQIEDGWKQAGVNADMISCGDEPSFEDDLADPFSLELWIKWHGWSSYNSIVTKGWDEAGGNIYKGWTFRNDTGDNNKFNFIKRENVANRKHWRGSSNISDTTNFHHLVLSTDGGLVDADQHIWMDGVAEVLNNYTSVGVVADISTNDTVKIGNNTGIFHFPANATFDEFRWSNQARSTDWVAAQYGNQDDPGAFYTPGAVEYPPAPAGGAPVRESLMGIGLAIGMGI